MTKFKVGDWVKSKKGRIGRFILINKDDDSFYIRYIDYEEYPIDSFWYHSNDLKEFTKLTPKFDNFEDLFEEENKLPTPKFRIGERVIIKKEDPFERQILKIVHGVGPHNEEHYLYWLTDGNLTHQQRENHLYKLNDPEILRVGDKVKSLEPLIITCVQKQYELTINKGSLLRIKKKGEAGLWVTADITDFNVELFFYYEDIELVLDEEGE